jgi:hypothetical protein
MSAEWQFHDSGGLDPGVYNEAWYATNYAAACPFCWATGRAVFWQDPSSLGFACASLDTQLSFQNAVPLLFRRSFVVPAGLGTNVGFRLRFVADDGLILYLNGRAAYTFNANPASGSVTAASRASASINPTCLTNVDVSLSLLVPGTNWIAAAVLQSVDPEVDTLFGLELDGIFLRTSPLPADPPTNQLVLSMTRQASGVRLSWPTGFGGYCLQYKTDMNPSLPWIPVSNQANPFTASFSDGTRLYRLRKP